MRPKDHTNTICHLNHILGKCYKVGIESVVIRQSGVETTYCSLNISIVVPIILENLLRMTQLFCKFSPDHIELACCISLP